VVSDARRDKACRCCSWNWRRHSDEGLSLVASTRTSWRIGKYGRGADTIFISMGRFNTAAATAQRGKATFGLIMLDRVAAGTRLRRLQAYFTDVSYVYELPRDGDRGEHDRTRPHRTPRPCSRGGGS